MKKFFGAFLAMMMATASLSCLATDASPAPSAEPTTSGGGLAAWLPIILYLGFIVLLAYFMIIRPNKKRKQQEADMRNSIMLGSEVTTIGGIVGRVVNIKDDEITIETSIDKTLMVFKNWAIREVKNLETADEAAE